MKKYTKVKDWYIETYKSDKIGDNINEDITFYDIFKALNNHKNIYKIIGITDNIIRERIFNELANEMETSYEYIHAQWLLCPDK